VNQSPRAGVCRRHGAGRLAMGALVCLLLTACSGLGSGAATQETSPPSSAVAGDYWPTDGWRTAPPSNHGVDPAALAMVEDQVAKGPYLHIRSVLIVRGGYLVYEHYWQGLDQADGHDVRSVTKSVIGALVGIALAEGKIKSLDQTVGELLPAQLPKDADPRFAGVTVKQLLTMTSGLAGDDGSLGGDSRIEDAMWSSSDWVRHILSRRLVWEPGTQWAYSNASSHLLSAIVANVSGQSTLEFARAKLFNPHGIRTDGAFEPVLSDHIDAATVEAYERASAAWPVDPQGYHYGASELRLPARDLAKFGHLYLNGGRWDNKQLIPAAYVAAATSPRGSSPNLDNGYGWHWWVDTDGEHRSFSARGRGGQFIYVVPDLDLVTVVTCDPEKGSTPGKLITQTIVPAVTN
jgi:CubicO group peptidase (beta-lactamase class C family)